MVDWASACLRGRFRAEACDFSNGQHGTDQEKETVKRLKIPLLVVSAAVLAAAVYFFGLRNRGVFLYAGVEGPKTVTVVTPAAPTPWRRYHGGTGSRLAVLLTDEHSPWLGLAHGLKSAGIPFTVTTDYREAVTHKVVLVYPVISGAVLSAQALRALAALPGSGGTLIGDNVLGGGMNQLFGFSQAQPSRNRHLMRIEKAPLGDLLLTGDKETTIPMGKGGEKSLGSYGYLSPTETPVAVFDDGSAAITRRRIGSGHAYAFGLDLGEYLSIGYNNRETGIARSYVNDYEPSIDVLLRLLREMYRVGESRAVTIGTVPQGKDLAVIISHDIDYTRSLDNSMDYAAFERSAGIRATYFLQTKYLRDWNDACILNSDSPALLKQQVAEGMEIGSHTVSHSRIFAKFPLGSGQERYPSYRPFVKSKYVAYNGTILGELRVSRFLIESLTGGRQKVVSFRPGHLADPYQLPEALVATDYRYSSSVTANNSLTHWPFQLNYLRETTSEVPIFEFPVTVEDEAKPRLDRRLPAALELAGKLRRYGGLFVILIHPDILGYKLAFERGFIAGVKDYSWFGTMAEFGSWWAARDQVGVDVEAGAKTLRLHVTAAKPLAGLALTVPPGWQLSKGAARLKGRTLLIDQAAGDAWFTLVR